MSISIHLSNDNLSVYVERMDVERKGRGREGERERGREGGRGRGERERERHTDLLITHSLA